MAQPVGRLGRRALLLVFTPDRAFAQIIPWLLLLATVTLVLGQRLSLGLRRLRLQFGRRSLLVAQFALGVYGGYFGGAVGLMMLAVWSLATRADLPTMPLLWVRMVAAANGAAAICFALAVDVRWRETLAVMTGGWSAAISARAWRDSCLRRSCAPSF